MIPRSMWLWVLACSCTGGSAGPATPAAGAGAVSSRPLAPIAVQPGDVAITGVSVVPMSSDGVLAHHTVVIRGERIVAVAPSASVVLPDGVKVIDGTGKWLMPGLADMHVHTWSDGLPHEAGVVEVGALEAKLADVVTHNAPPNDPWSGVPPLAAEGNWCIRHATTWRSPARPWARSASWLAWPAASA